MSLILAILSDPFILAIGGGIVAAFFAFMKGRTSGAEKERAKQDVLDRKALVERLEMHNDTSDFRRQAREMSDADLDKRLTR